MNRLEISSRRLVLDICLVLCFAMGISVPALAQDRDTKESSPHKIIKLNQRIRIQAPDVSSKRIIGRVDSLRGDTLILYVSTGIKPHYRRIPAESITRCEISMGKKSNTGKGALYGFAFGGLFGGLIYIAGGGEEDESGDYIPDLFIIPVFAVIGTGLGTILGALARSDIWQEIPPDRVSVTMTPRVQKMIKLEISLMF